MYLFLLERTHSRECEGIHTTNSQEWEEEHDAEPQYYVEDDRVILRIGLGAAKNLRLEQKIWCNEQVEAIPETYKLQSCVYLLWCISSKFANDTLCFLILRERISIKDCKKFSEVFNKVSIRMSRSSRLTHRAASRFRNLSTGFGFDTR